MKCDRCGEEYSILLYSSCPYCGHRNSTSLLRNVFGPDEAKKDPLSKSRLDPHDWNNPDNCSDAEYMDDEDYDDFDS